jgi:hypothetical protein
LLLLLLLLLLLPAETGQVLSQQHLDLLLLLWHLALLPLLLLFVQVPQWRQQRVCAAAVLDQTVHLPQH